MNGAGAAVILLGMMRSELVAMCVGVVVSGCVVPDEVSVDDFEVGPGPQRNGRIAYSQLTSLPIGSGHAVTVIERDGTNATRMPPGSEAIHEYDPAWSPRGNRMLFASSGDSTGQFDTDIFVVNADGTCLKQLTQRAASNNREPSWSPDGRKIAFRRNCHVFTMNTDGSGLTRLAPGGCAGGTTTQSRPRWSPDGQKILFYGEHVWGGAREVFTMNPDGTQIINLTNSPADDTHADWSPDGSQIVFRSDGEVSVMNADGSGVTRLTDMHGSVYAPSFAPDGRKILFLAHEPGAGYHQVFKMYADGSGVRSLADDSSIEDADWAPRFHGVSVTWMNTLRVTVDCNSVQKKLAVALAWNAGAASIETLAGDGELEFTTAESTTQKAAGLSHGDQGTDWRDIDFAFHLRDDGGLFVREGGSFSRRVGSYVAGDTFRVQVKAGVVTYWQNGVQLYRSLATPVFPLLVDTSLRTPGATIQDVTLETD